MKKINFVLALSLLGTLGCPAKSNPPPPTLGAQIDRLGRPAVNTALTDPFNLDAAATTLQHKDAYNAASDPTTWQAMFSSEIAANLAIFDSADTMCGNQLAAKPTSGGVVPPDRYAPLAGVLADDELYVDTSKTACGLYLALEADATGLAPGNGKCGGRTPLDSTVVETYQLLTTGTICALNPAVCGINDGLDGTDHDGTASLTVFPFLQAPN